MKKLLFALTAVLALAACQKTKELVIADHGPSQTVTYDQSALMGSIVNFSSQAARDGGGPGASMYATAKAAVMCHTRAMAKELGPRGIRVNSVTPGMINTTFHDTFTKPEARENLHRTAPLRREGEASEVADLVAFLASSESSYITGASIDINGGVLFS